MIFAPLKRKFLGDVLLNLGLINKDQLKIALEEQKATGDKLGEVFISLGYVNEEDILKARAHQHGLSYKKLSDVPFNEELRKVLPNEMAKKFNVMPLERDENTITIAMDDPNNVVTIEEVESKTGLKAQVVLSAKEDIRKAIEKFYGGLAAELSELPEDAVEEITGDDEEELLEGEYDAQDAPIVKYVNSIIHEAVVKNASDVHIEPLENGVELRLRIDGKLREFPGPTRTSLPAIISRIKIMANLDIAERRMPQDGKSRVKVSGKKVDIRISTLPTIYGEKVVMRILQRSEQALELSSLGFAKTEEKRFKDILQNPYGMIIVTGPTGSGKTTTLYAGLGYINEPEKNIITIEDPVEYELNKINQVQVKPIIGLNFVNILRSVLRQDPDVIMVGEIRDKETADIAIQASLTGHLVLSTLHTNDAVSTISRMKFMGINSYLIADAVELVLAQRLIRKICPDCKTEQEVPTNILKKLNLVDDASEYKFFHGKGCDSCFGSGYKGRTAIYELLIMSPEIKKMVINDANEVMIREKAREEGMSSLRDEAVIKLKDGITTVEEVLSVTFG